MTARSSSFWAEKGIDLITMAVSMLCARGEKIVSNILSPRRGNIAHSPPTRKGENGRKPA
jgi:hypothetical protein